MAPSWNEQFDAIVIGSGFGGAVAITKLIETGLPDIPKPRVLVLERGTWWGNPEGPGIRKHNPNRVNILDRRQWWPRPNDSQGLAYIANSIYKEHDPVWDVFNPFSQGTTHVALANHKSGEHMWLAFITPDGTH